MEWTPVRATRTNPLLDRHSPVMLRQHHQNDMRWLATHSPMTRLLNRSGFVAEADRLLRSHRRSFALLWIELEELDVIRQVFGFAVGDAALEVAAARLGRARRHCRRCDRPAGGLGARGSGADGRE